MIKLHDDAADRRSHNVPIDIELRLIVLCLAKSGIEASRPLCEFRLLDCQFSAIE